MWEVLRPLDPDRSDLVAEFQEFSPVKVSHHARSKVLLRDSTRVPTSRGRNPIKISSFIAGQDYVASTGSKTCWNFPFRRRETNLPDRALPRLVD